MVVGQIRFGVLLLVAPQALVVHLAARLDRPRSGLGLALEWVAAFAMGPAMNGVAVAALDVLGLVGTGKPVAHVIRLGVAAQAGAVGLFGLAVFEADDFVFRLLCVAPGREVQASGAVTLLTVDFAQRVRAAAIVFGRFGVTLRTLIFADFRGTLDFDVLAEVLLRFVAGLGLGLAENRRSDEN